MTCVHMSVDHQVISHRQFLLRHLLRQKMTSFKLFQQSVIISGMLHLYLFFQPYKGFLPFKTSRFCWFIFSCFYTCNVLLLLFFFSFLFYFLRSMVSNGEILQHKASIGHSSNSGRAEDSDLEVCFNFPDSWLPITINMITPLLQLMEIGHMPKLWIPGCQIFAINFFHFEYLCSSYLK